MIIPHELISHLRQWSQKIPPNSVEKSIDIDFAWELSCYFPSFLGHPSLYTIDMTGRPPWACNTLDKDSYLVCRVISCSVSMYVGISPVVISINYNVLLYIGHWPAANCDAHSSRCLGICLCAYTVYIYIIFILQVRITSHLWDFITTNDTIYSRFCMYVNYGMYIHLI